MIKEHVLDRHPKSNFSFCCGGSGGGGGRGNTSVSQKIGKYFSSWATTLGSLNIFTDTEKAQEQLNRKGALIVTKLHQLGRRFPHKTSLKVRGKSELEWQFIHVLIVWNIHVLTIVWNIHSEHVPLRNIQWTYDSWRAKQKHIIGIFSVW